MNEVKRSCVDCKTTKTPLWRSGPDGPRSLCNACGIRYRKRKMADDGKPSSDGKRDESSSSSNPIGEDDDDDDLHRGGMNVSLKMRFRDLGKKMRFSASQLKRQRSENSKKKLGEVEQAAALLMSLSCGFVFA